LHRKKRAAAKPLILAIQRLERLQTDEFFNSAGQY